MKARLRGYQGLRIDVDLLRMNEDISLPIVENYAAPFRSFTQVLGDNLLHVARDYLHPHSRAHDCEF
jgi:hypothetical protein